jgi:hypothetical protein
MLKIERRVPQTLRIEVRGADVARLEGNRSAGEEQSENAVPDVVERWVRAINAGLLGGPSCRAAVIYRHHDGDSGHQLWDVRIEAVDWGAFRVLRNLLLARDFDERSVRTLVTLPDGGRMLDGEVLGFPTLPKTLPFDVRRPASAESAELCVEIAFGLPTDEVIDNAVAALDLWAELVVWGGYAPWELDPRESGSIPRGAILYDEFTVLQGFERPFRADMAAFDAPISYALGLEARGLFVASVVVR